MAMDQNKDHKKPEQEASEAKSALVQEAQTLTKAASSPSDSEKKQEPVLSEKKSDAVASLTLTPKLELNVGADAQNSLALKSVMREKGLTAQTPPSYSWSVLDTVASVVKKTGDIISSSTILNYLNPVAAGIGAGISLGTELVRVAENMYQSKDKKLTVSKVNFQEASKLKDDWQKMFDSDAPSSTTVAKAGTSIIEFGDIYNSVKKPTESNVDRVSSVDEKNGLNKDMMNWLFDKNEKPQGVAISDNLFSYTDEKKEKTEISTEAGRVHIEKSDAQGNVKTIVDKTTGKTMVLHGKESVMIENGKEIVKGEGYKITWDDQNKRHIILDSGNEIIRDGDAVKMVIGGEKLEVTPHQLDAIGSGFSFVDSADNLTNKTEDIRKTLKPGETHLLAIKGVGTRTIFEDGTTFDVQRDKARLETPDHQVFRFEIKDGQLFVRKDGELVALDSDKSPIKAVDGKFKIGDLVIDQKELCIKTDGDNRPGGHHPKQDSDCSTKNTPVCAPIPADAGTCSPAVKEIPGTVVTDQPGGCAPQDTKPNPFNVNIGTGEFTWVAKDGTKWIGTISPDGSTKMTDGTKVIENNTTDSKVKITTVTPPATDATAPVDANKVAPKPEVTTIDLATTTIDTPVLIDGPKKTVIKDTETVIDENRTVDFKDGPKVKRDGTVQVDNKTWVGNDLHVYSHGWDSIAAQTGTKISISESNAQTAAMSKANRASSAQNIAKAGVVRWTEIASLNSALSDVASLMGSVPAGSPAHAMLLRSYSMLVQAINDATPKAQAAERAISLNGDSANTGNNTNESKKNRSAA